MAAQIARVKARLARIPPKVKEAVAAQLKTEADNMVEAMKRAAPVSGDPHAQPGLFRDSIHAYQNPQRELSWRVIADARDEQGHFIGGHIEYGHRARDGTHVPASPSFWPTYRSRKKPMRRRLSAAARKAIKAEWPG